MRQYQACGDQAYPLIITNIIIIAQVGIQRYVQIKFPLIHQFQCGISSDHLAERGGFKKGVIVYRHFCFSVSNTITFQPCLFAVPDQYSLHTGDIGIGHPDRDIFLEGFNTFVNCFSGWLGNSC